MDAKPQLIERAQQGDKSAAEQLVLENAGLIWSIARRYFGRGVEADDLYQLGALGFLKAIAGFDTRYGTQFSTYAVPKIAGEIRRFLRDDGAVKVSRSVKERAGTIKKERQRLMGELGREPTLSELSDALGIPPEEIASAEMATGSAESIQRQTGEEGITLEDGRARNGRGDFGADGAKAGAFEPLRARADGHLSSLLPWTDPAEGRLHDWRFAGAGQPH